MDSKTVKEILKFAAINKDEISELLCGLDPKNIGYGEICISEKLINKGLWDFVKTRSGDKLDDYTVNFDGGRIFVEVIAKVLLVKVKVNLIVTITSLEFDANGHRLTFTYEKDGNSPGNAVVPKALEKVAEKNPTILFVRDNRVVVNIDGIPGTEQIPYWLTLKYLNSIAGRLKLGYRILG